MIKHKILFAKVTMYAAGLLAVAALLLFLMLGDNVGSQYFWGALAAVPLTIISAVAKSRYKYYDKLQLLQDNWGQPQTRHRDFDSISYMFRHSQFTDKAVIDDTTWTDLNMDGVFTLIDRTQTNAGESMLYSLLRTPCTPKTADELQRRQHILNLLEDKQLREKLQTILLRLERDDLNRLTHLLWDDVPPKNSWAIAYTLLAIAAVLALVSPIFIGIRSITWIIGIFTANSILHYKITSSFSYQIPAISNLHTFIKTARKLTRTELPGLEAEQQMLRDALKSTGKILRRTRLILPSTSTSELLFFLEYIKILFLSDVRSFYRVLEELRRQAPQLRQAYQVVGLLDALQAVVSYRSHTQYTLPEFLSTPTLDVQGIRHPLLKDAVPNSISIGNQGILITGSNMAGKSTFLRTLGVNVILAQSIYTCLTDKYRASYLQVMSSINKADDIDSSTSLYYAEAKRLLKVIQPDYGEIPALCLIDELLSGTNYVERLAASRAILHYLQQQNVLVVVATHDLDLAEELEGSYQCYHFTDKMDGSNLDFDYTLKKGVATTHNAIKLLAHLGYPEAITSNILT